MVGGACGGVRDILEKLTEHDVLLATHSAELRHLGEEVERLWAALQPIVDTLPNFATKQDLAQMAVGIIEYIDQRFTDELAPIRAELDAIKARLDRVEARLDGQNRLLSAIAISSGVDDPESYLEEG